MRAGGEPDVEREGEREDAESEGWAVEWSLLRTSSLNSSCAADMVVCFERVSFLGLHELRGCAREMLGLMRGDCTEWLAVCVL